MTVEEAVARLAVIEAYDNGGGPAPCVHTFRVGALMLGAHWTVEQARAAFEEHGVAETTDPRMRALGHGLCIHDNTGPVFFETKR